MIGLTRLVCVLVVVMVMSLGLLGPFHGRLVQHCGIMIMAVVVNRLRGGPEGVQAKMPRLRLGRNERRTAHGDR